MKNYQQTVKQRRVKLNKLKHAFALSHKSPDTVWENNKDWCAWFNARHYNRREKRELTKASKLVLSARP